jgi:MFS family permease
MAGNGTGDLRDAGVGELLKQLSQETSTLVRQELALAKAELAEKGRRAGIGAGMMGAAAVVGLAALGALVAFLILVLAEAMAAWGAALIVTLALGALAGALALVGKNKIKEATPPVPEQAVESVKEDVEWAKTQISSAKR